MKSIKRFFLLLSLSLSISMINPAPLQAQCPMCRVSAEQNLKMGGTAGKGLNKGILFMLAAPYLIVATMGVYWLKIRKKEEEILD